MKKDMRKLRFGGIAAVITAAVLAAVVLFNVLFTTLAANGRWYIDMTSEALFTLSDECLDIVKDGFAASKKNTGKDAEVTIYFCDDPDNLNGHSYMRYVYGTALDLADACPEISVEYLNWEYNPTSVKKFRKTGTKIDNYSIIVESGEEYRVFSLESMFVTDDSGDVWAYNGEKKFAGAILAVTDVEVPCAYVTTSHSEVFYDTALLELASTAGYNVLSEGDAGKLSGAENPLNAPEMRLVIIYNPSSDFEKTELSRLDKFLEDNNSVMVFLSPDSPVLPNLEEWLSTWGVTVERYRDDDGKIYNYQVRDNSSSLDSAGYSIKAEYVKTGGYGNSIYSQLLDNGYAPPVIFEDAASLTISPTFTIETNANKQDSSLDYRYGEATVDGVIKQIFDVFTSSASAVAEADGEIRREANEDNPFKFMTITRRRETVQETNYLTTDKNALLLVSGSTEFAKAEYLESSVYGNSDVLLSAMTLMGREVVPVGINFKPFASTVIEDITDAEANRITVLLTVLPTVAVIGVGVFVLVRRKYR